MQGAAGPHQLPPGEPDMEGNDPLGCDSGSDDETQIVEGPSASSVRVLALPNRLLLIAVADVLVIQSGGLFARLHSRSKFPAYE